MLWVGGAYKIAFMMGDVISDHFLMLQKDSLDTVGFRTFRTFFGGGIPI